MKRSTSTNLTQREIQIAKLICRQYSNKKIAEKLGLTLRTVEDYRSNLMKKTKSKNAIGIVLYAIRIGLFTPKLPD